MEQLQTEDHTLSQMRVLQRILCCPTAKTALSLVSLPDLVARLPEQERARLSAQTASAFVSESIGVAYPIVGRIISFLERDALRLQNAGIPAPVPTEAEDETVKQNVKAWYDEFGWKKNDKGLYYDTALFSQDKPTGHGLYSLASHLSLIDRLTGGEFMLDAASGALPHAEHHAYSWYYRYRICVDISLTALQEAERKVGGTGFCCLTDICKLPFWDGTVDGIVSAYTIQHIPEAQQVRALQELFRVLRPAAHLCVITEVQPTRWHHALFLGFRAIRKILRGLGIGRSAARPESRADPAVVRPPQQLYSRLHDWQWWRRRAEELTSQCSVECLRLLRKSEYEWLFGQSTRAAKLVRAGETCFPRSLARASAYCLIDLWKPSCLSAGSSCSAGSLDKQQDRG